MRVENYKDAAKKLNGCRLRFHIQMMSVGMMRIDRRSNKLIKEVSFTVKELAETIKLLNKLNTWKLNLSA